MESNVCPKCGKVMTVVVCGAVGSDLMAVCECGHNHERVGIDYAYAAQAEVATLRRALEDCNAAHNAMIVAETLHTTSGWWIRRVEDAMLKARADAGEGEG